ncbi:MAG: xanthine dehydrogenase accessory protein XdhC [Pseudomonadota bacterium]
MTPVTVEIIATRGSAPRDAGTVMVVRADGIDGTIGGGALEHRAIRTARTAALPLEETIPLGPDLGQCCGGAVTLRYSEGASVADTRSTMPALPDGTLPPLWVWGAGHVGRAVIRALPHGAAATWIDTAPDRFPARAPDQVTCTHAADLPRLMPYAPRDAAHLIFTYSHDLDLALCDAALRHDFAFCGVIGSATKWARFRKRLAAMGHAPARIARLTCPIGDPALGKHPDAIAHGALAQLLRRPWGRT